jgi:molybdopterin/thiamine biosynthesis adenylyltransferase
MIWWIENPERSAKERLAIESLAGSVDWVQILGLRMDGTHLCWDADIVTVERLYPITLRYPDHFPGSPPLIFPRGVQERWSYHQYGVGGELCLEFGPDNWHHDLTGAEMLQSAHRLLSGEEQSASGGPEVGSRHKESLGQQLRTRSNRLFITLSGQKVISGLGEFETLSGAVIVMYRKGARTFVLARAGDGDSEWKATLPPAMLGSTFSLNTKLIRWPSSIDLPQSKGISLFREAFQREGFEINGSECLIVIKGTDVVAFDLALSGDVGPLAVVLEGASAPRLDAEHIGLDAKKVAVIGCGSMGSKIATMLARSGVGKFVLVDDDILLPENLVRNELDWRDVARHKVDALADKLQYVRATVACQRYRRSLGGQESSTSIETLIEVLTTCDLLIDATADSGAFNYLSSIARLARKTMVWGEVFAGGFGGFIARSRPTIDPDPASMRQSVLHWSNEQGRVIGRAPGRYEGDEENPAIADDAEVAIIASHMALLAMDTLLSREPSSYPYAVYMIGLRAGWIFDQAFEVRPIDVGPPLSETHVDFSDEDKRKEIERLVELIADHPNANTATS